MYDHTDKVNKVISFDIWLGEDKEPLPWRRQKQWEEPHCSKAPGWAENASRTSDYILFHFHRAKKQLIIKATEFAKTSH